MQKETSNWPANLKRSLELRTYNKTSKNDTKVDKTSNRQMT